jgi:hypothetical protein
MRSWYHPRDLLGFADEHAVPETSAMQTTIAHIAAVSDLALMARDADYLPALPQSGSVIEPGYFAVLSLASVLEVELGELDG